MATGPLIGSPAMDKRADRMASLRVEDVVRDAAVKVAGTLVAPMRSAIRAAGGSVQLANEVRVHDGHLNELVMRDRGSKGDVIVGVGGESLYADDAEELEWGSLDSGPRAWVRSTAGQRGFEVTAAWSNELTRGLDRGCR